MDDILTENTSIWIHGPASDISFEGMTITHTGGFSILPQATNASNQYDSGVYDISNIRVLNCNFVNNRPHLFGSTAPDAINGSWTGGIFCDTYGIQSGSNYLSTIQGLLVQGCYFMGNTGIQIWSHLYGFDQLFFDFRFLGNTFIDTGLDCIQFGGVSGGAAIGNRFRRTGYIPLDTTIDVSPTNTTIPKWWIDHNPVALDTSGICKNVTYANNTFISTNGGDIDADGFGYGTITGNVCWTPSPGDIEYDEDNIAISGPAADGVTYSYGCQPSNTSNTIYGGNNVQITSNTFINKFGGAIRGAATRNSLISENNISHPDVAGYAPIVLFNVASLGTVNTSGTAVSYVSGSNFSGFTNGSTITINSVAYTITTVNSTISITLSTSAGTQTGVSYVYAGSNQRAYSTAVINNFIRWNPASSASCIQEDVIVAGANWHTGDKNWVHGNQLIGNCNQFLKDPNTQSTTGISISLDVNSLQNRSDSFIFRNRAVATGKNFDYLGFGVDTTIAFTYSGFLYDKAVVGVSGYVSTSGTNVVWVSGDQFGDFVNGGSIIINGVTYTISTVNAVNSITLTGSAGVQTAVTFSDPIYKQGLSLLNIPGSISTGTRTALGVQDSVSTNISYVDGFMILTDTLIDQEKANKFDDTFGLFWYDSAANTMKVSTTTTAGVRDWTAIGGGGGSVGGSDKDVQINKTGAFYGDSNLQFDYTNQLLTVTGIISTPAILAVDGFIQSDGGFYTTSTASDAIQAPLGGVTALSLISIRNDGASGVTISRSSATANTYGFAVSSTGELELNDDTATAVRLSVAKTTGLITIGSTVSIDQAGAISLTGVLNSTGGSGGVNVSGNTAYNAIQTIGGVYGVGGTTVDQADYMKALGSAPNTPGGGYGGLGYKTGSIYWFWDGAAFATCDLSGIASSSITSVNAQTGPAITIDAGVGITVTNPVANTIRITNTGSSVAGSDKWIQFNDGGSAFGATTDLQFSKVSKVLTVTGSTGTAGIVTTTSFIQSAEGFYTTSISYQAIQAPSGGVYGSSLEAINYVQPGRRSSDPTATSGDTIADGCVYYNTSSVALKVRISGTFVNLLTTLDSRVNSITGTANQVLANGTTTTQTGAVTLTLPQSIATTTNVNFGTITGSGLISTSVSGTAFQAGSGNFSVNSSGAVSIAGVLTTSAGVNVTTITNFNSIQTTGGVYGVSGLTSDQAIYLKSTGGPSSPGGSYGALGYSSGSSYWYWNGSSYGLVNLSLFGVGVTSVTASGAGISASPTTGAVIISNTGVTSLQSSTGALSLVNGTGIGISGLTISNTGVTSLQGSTGALSLTAGTGVSIGGLTISIGQAVGTGNSPSFVNMTLSGSISVTSNGTFGGFVQATGNLNTISGGIATGSTIRITNGGAIQNISTINMSGNLTSTGALLASGNISTNGTYSVSGSFFGQDATGGLVCGSRTLFFKSGILYAFV